MLKIQKLQCAKKNVLKKKEKHDIILFSNVQRYHTHTPIADEAVCKKVVSEVTFTSESLTLTGTITIVLLL